MTPARIAPELAKLGANTIRMLAVDGVEKARSGHPGLPMGAADYAFVLWSRYLRFNPEDPQWPNRDRFIVGRAWFDASVRIASPVRIRLAPGGA